MFTTLYFSDFYRKTQKSMHVLIGAFSSLVFHYNIAIFLVFRAISITVKLCTSINNDSSALPRSLGATLPFPFLLEEDMLISCKLTLSDEGGTLEFEWASKLGRKSNHFITLNVHKKISSVIKPRAYGAKPSKSSYSQNYQDGPH